jgi:hypothetical protein
MNWTFDDVWLRILLSYGEDKFRGRLFKAFKLYNARREQRSDNIANPTAKIIKQCGESASGNNIGFQI